MTILLEFWAESNDAAILGLLEIAPQKIGYGPDKGGNLTVVLGVHADGSTDFFDRIE